MSAVYGISAVDSTQLNLLGTLKGKHNLNFIVRGTYFVYKLSGQVYFLVYASGGYGVRSVYYRYRSTVFSLIIRRGKLERKSVIRRCLALFFAIGELLENVMNIWREGE